MPYPGSRTLSETVPLSSHRVATGRFDGTLPSVVAEGVVTRRIWQLTGAETTLQVLAPLRAQLLDDGWEEVFECTARACGGFDFRFEIDVAPAPAMFVDLADFRYLAARREDAWTTLLVSRSAGMSFVQQVEVRPAGTESPDGASAEVAPTPVAASDIAPTLVATGHAVLSDLDFETGSATLARDGYASLDALATFLAANPATTIALVGHTDAQGGAAGNLAISRRRAESVRALLVETYGVASARVETQGVGFFAPIARNDTEAGRRANRRVEVVITSTR